MFDDSKTSRIKSPADWRLIVSLLILAICFAIWLCARISFLYTYQMPSQQTVHPNYLTFHEMSVSLEEGAPLGTIDVSRMVANSKHNLMANYDKTSHPGDLRCNYLTLDPGYSIILYAARHVMTFLTDSYLCSVVLQFVLDGLMLFLIFVTFLRWGLLPAAAASALFAINPTFSYNTIQPFSYFWEGMLTALAILGIIWARRFMQNRRNWAGILCLIAAGAAMGFGVWVRANLMAAGVFMVVFLYLAPATRRYAAVFLLAFALLITPQIMRASSVAGHFATSTRMVWHTALHGLGRYPNAYGILDDDMYPFDISHDKYGVTYNFCDYRAHDTAIKDYYLKFVHAHPEFVTRVIISRIITNIYFNFTPDFSVVLNIILLVAAGVGTAFALLAGGELLFIAALALPIYLGMNVAIGLIYYIQPPYAYVTQWCEVILAVLCVPAIVHGWRYIQWHRRGRPVDQKMLRPSRWAWLRAGGFVLFTLGFTAALAWSPLHDYVFIETAYAPYWTTPAAPAAQNLRDLHANWEKLPKPRQDAFLAYIHKYVASTGNALQDISNFAASKLFVMGYFDRIQNQNRNFLIYNSVASDLMPALRDVSTSVIGWKINQVAAFDVAQPDSWDGNKIKVSLDPAPERVQSDYKKFAVDKLYRWNWQVTWLDDNNFVAVHLPKGCDELRQRLAVFYNGSCPTVPNNGAVKKN